MLRNHNYKTVREEKQAPNQMKAIDPSESHYAKLQALSKGAFSLSLKY